MALQEMDISWQVLRRIVQDWAGESAELTEAKSLVGGCINTTLALSTKGGAKAVLKISPHRVNRQYAREAHQLRLLRKLGLPAPEVYACHMASLDNPHSFLLMEHLEGMDLVHAKKAATPDEFAGIQRHLAELVLAMHGNTGPQYHREVSEEVPHFESWPEFYRHVYDPIWADVAKSPVMPPKTRKVMNKIHDRLERLIAHDDRPRLVHWDIWATNILAAPDAQGQWRITGLLDPNCKFAHAEAEIAYMELFQTITPAFLDAYQQAHKLSSTYHQLRKHIYQLYPLMNHVNLFGNGYVKALLAAVEKVGALV
jgi:fructosamine-3-kinase